LQYLPPRQRAVLLLREVLAFSAAEVAEMLGISTAAVKSILQRARARLDVVAPVADQVSEPTEPMANALLDQYIAAFESSDEPEWSTKFGYPLVAPSRELHNKQISPGAVGTRRPTVHGVVANRRQEHPS
jgi:hypothetical protein